MIADYLSSAAALSKLAFLWQVSDSKVRQLSPLPTREYSDNFNRLYPQDLAYKCSLRTGDTTILLREIKNEFQA